MSSSTAEVAFLQTKLVHIVVIISSFSDHCLQVRDLWALLYNCHSCLSKAVEYEKMLDTLLSLRGLELIMLFKILHSYGANIYFK